MILSVNFNLRLKVNEYKLEFARSSFQCCPRIKTFHCLSLHISLSLSLCLCLSVCLSFSLFLTVITTTHFCSDLVLKSACFYLFCPAYSEQVEQFLIPAMVYSKFPFPFVELIQSLLQQTSPIPNSSKRTNVIEPSPWLLGSVIAFADKNIGKHRNTCNISDKNSRKVFLKVSSPLCILL